ncbi:MAG: Decarbamoylnovobiocin carbamoyltransferase [Planctomycetota bacterium]|jgi:carbamoyltransferase
MTAILGLSAFYHDSAAALIVDGKIIAAAQEERFSRKKHDPGFPALAVEYCLKEAGIDLDQVDYVAFYDKPLVKFERLLESYLAFAPSGFKSFAMALPLWLKDKVHTRKAIRTGLGRPDLKSPLVFLDHHESHAASAFFASPYEEAAILTLDGVGEWSTTTLGVGRGNQISLTQQMQFPHSLGLLYSAFTYYCGFKVNSGEYKLMGLAPYGIPKYADAVFEKLVDLKPDGSFWMDQSYFNYAAGLTMTGPKFHALFGRGPRKSETQIEQFHCDMAASIQAVTEKIMMLQARYAHEQTGMKHLVLAGGVALNCVANGKIQREGPFESIWIQPAAGDAGGALGSALFVWYQLLNHSRNADGVHDFQTGSFLGPKFETQEICDMLDRENMPYEKFDDQEGLYSKICELLEQEQIVGLFQGRMEFGPRALGARSIIGDPRSAKMQSNMNLKIKFRESFRPFAPIVMREHAHEWFEIRSDQESPYMLIVAPVLESRRIKLEETEMKSMTDDPDLRRRVNIVRSTIPAVTHVDFSARLQTIDQERNPFVHALLNRFYDRTGCPVLVNTSFNVRGEPIVCQPEEALRCFLSTEMDALVLENCIIRKNQLGPEALETAQKAREKYLSQFELD